MSVFIFICLFARSLVMPLPWLVVGSGLWITTIIIIITIIIITRVGKPSKTIDLLGILGHLQLSFPVSQTSSSCSSTVG